MVVRVHEVTGIELSCRSEIGLLGIDTHFDQVPIPFADVLLLVHRPRVTKQARESIAGVRVLFGLCIDI